MMIKLSNVIKTYTQGQVQTEVLKGIQLEIAKGDFVAIVGTSGCGKSTLINIIGLLDSEFEGEHILKGEDVTSMSEQQRAMYRNEYIGFIFQNFNLIDEYTVKENILVPFLYSTHTYDMQYIQELIKNLGLEDKLNDYPNQLSGGQKQRVAMIRAMAHKPLFLIADEPTGALDEANRDEILRIFKRINNQGTTVIVVTHDDVVASYCDRIYVMRNGKVTLKEVTTDEN